jgi:hypothetical protein
MDHLSLPAFDYRLKNEDNKTLIFDQIRKKFVVLTPEEWVRQHFINYLIAELAYPKALINVEQGLKYNSLLKRSDIVVFARDGSPLVLIECKAAKHRLNQKVVEQAVMYNRTIGARYIIVTNGIESACLVIDKENSKVDYLPQVPSYEDL